MTRLLSAPRETSPAHAVPPPQPCCAQQPGRRLDRGAVQPFNLVRFALWALHDKAGQRR